ncbi:hypothetical protein ACPVPU_11410 [Sphingomonas sp. CJ99]
MFMLVNALMLAASAVPLPAHQVTIDHRGNSVTASYRADIAIDTRQRGTSAGLRPSTRRCDWQAVVQVGRTVNGSTLPARIVATDRSQKGSLAGDCAVLKDQINAAVARRTPAIEQRLAAIAADDRATLLAEIDRLAVVASND